MDIRLAPATLPQPVRPGLAIQGKSVAAASSASGSFTGALKNALSAVSQSQNHASTLQREMQLENPKVSLEETMVAIQKAQLGFQASLHVRNRMVQAYTDVMNMQV